MQSLLRQRYSTYPRWRIIRRLEASWRQQQKMAGSGMIYLRQKGNHICIFWQGHRPQDASRPEEIPPLQRGVRGLAIGDARDRRPEVELAGGSIKIPIPSNSVL